MQFCIALTQCPFEAIHIEVAVRDSCRDHRNVTLDPAAMRRHHERTTGIRSRSDDDAIIFVFFFCAFQRGEVRKLLFH
ncbi:hypothetical protein X766_08910 [Mesorhizobium sp. LSJC255A00]|nr:hypothetical protein X766_08910 [Mesorhizobium sp. LSJC255A00]